MSRLSTVVDFTQARERSHASGAKEETKPSMTQSPAVVAQRGPRFLQEETLQTEQIKKLSPRLKELMAMLEYCRPEGSDTEEHFISAYLDTLPNMTKDAYGNRICKVGKGSPTVAWSSHTDTVHYDEGTQAIEIDKHGLIGLDFYSAANCLGADCTSGVWLMRRMIMAGKPGLYIFHRGEESGGQGSRWIASNTPELVEGIEAMIALDRRGYADVITEQTTGVTASNAFAQSLADQLNAYSGFQNTYKPDDGGIFTDSAFYNHLIPECTNISVGYFSQHSKKEALDHDFLDDLLLSLLKLDYSKLTIARDPKAASSDPWGSDRWGYYYKGADCEHDSAMDKYYKEQWDTSSGFGSTEDRELVDLIRRHPEATARLLGYWDLDQDDLYAAISDYKKEEG
jgi:hypothetical protein